MGYLVSAAAAAAVAVVAGSASAAIIEFNTAGDNVASLGFSEEGVSGTVTPSSNTFALRESVITQSAGGIGVYTDRYWPLPDDTDPDLDNQGGDERLTFSFDSPVYLSKVWFGDLDDDDDIAIYVNGSYFGAGDDTTNPFDFGGVQVSSFAIEASCSIFDCIIGADDSFLVAKFEASTTPNTGVVPLPASGLLLLAGAGGLAALRRRKG